MSEGTKELVFLLEGKSDIVMLEGIIRKCLDTTKVAVQYIPFEGKTDLKNQLKKKIRHYNNPHACFIVLCDQDSDDCKKLKQKLKEKIPSDKRDRTRIRIACRELESFYLGDLDAVKEGLGMQKITLPAKYKNLSPDEIPDEKPSGILEKITQDKYQKVSGSRAIAPHLSIKENTSPSFRVLVKAIDTLAKLS